MNSYRDYIIVPPPYQQTHAKTGFKELLQMTAEEFLLLISLGLLQDTPTHPQLDQILNLLAICEALASSRVSSSNSSQVAIDSSTNRGLWSTISKNCQQEENRGHNTQVGTLHYSTISLQ